MNKVVFLTGGTGFIGVNLIRHILSGSDAKIIALVRGDTVVEGHERLSRIFSLVASPDEQEQFERRVSVVCGDVSLPNLGLCENDLLRVTSESTHILHSAANVNFETPLEDARNVNVTGTKNLLAMATMVQRTGRLQRVGYIGTAFVSGRRPGVIEEDTLNDDTDFTNNYEQTKHEAEQAVRLMSGELPIVIFRPSVVVGDSSSGVTTSFNVLYTPLRLIQRRRVPALPGFRRTLLDVVPVDYVAKAIVHLMLTVSPPVARTYHLTAGEHHSCAIGEIVDKAVAFFNQRCPHEPLRSPWFIPPTIFRLALRVMRKAGQRVAKFISVYEPYMTVGRSFDTTNSTRDLAAVGIVPPTLTEYLESLLRYCIETNWGKSLART